MSWVMVPDGWNICEVGDCLLLLKSGLSRKLSPYDIGMPVIRSGNMGEKYTIFDDVKYWHINDPQGSNTASYVLDDGDILVNFINSRSQIGKTCIFRNKIKRDCIYTTNILRVKPNDKITTEYLHFLTKTSRYAWYIQSITKPAVNQASFTTKEFKKFHVSLPPLPEQKKIAHILSTWDRAIETVERLIENSKAQKKALMQQLLTGKRRFPGFEEMDWKDIQLGALGSTFGGLSGKTKEHFGSGVPFIPYINIFNNSKVDVKSMNFVRISPGERQNKTRYGDVFFTTSSETSDEVGMSSVLLDEVNELYLNSFCFGFRMRSFNLLTPEYARCLLRGCQFRKDIFRLAQGSTRYNLSKKEFLKIKIRLPSIPEQGTITRILNQAEEVETKLQVQHGHLVREKKALMQQLLTGKRRVRMDRDEV